VAIAEWRDQEQSVRGTEEYESSVRQGTEEAVKEGMKRLVSGRNNLGHMGVAS
jgi:hypothetical protein